MSNRVNKYLFDMKIVIESISEFVADIDWEQQGFKVRIKYGTLRNQLGKIVCFFDFRPLERKESFECFLRTLLSMVVHRVLNDIGYVSHEGHKGIYGGLDSW